VVKGATVPVRRLLGLLGIGSKQAPADATAADWRPDSFRVVAADVGANVNHDGYCRCDAGFALDRAEPDPRAESCCCGNRIPVAVGAGTRLAVRLGDAGGYRIETRTVQMPWEAELEVALAVPTVG
jgi:hypothetical protein